MKRFRAHQFNQERAKQTRWLWRGVTFGTAAIVASASIVIWGPARHWFLWPLAVTLFTFGFVGILAALVALSHMPEPESENGYIMPLDSRPAEPLFVPRDNGQLIRPRLNMTRGEEMRFWSAVAANGWKLNRDRLIDAGFSDMRTYPPYAGGDTRFSWIVKELNRADLIEHDGRAWYVPEDRRGVFSERME